LEMVVGLLGILKAGGAYVPLDASYPKERLAFMVEDTEVPVLLTQEHLLANLPESEAQVLCLDTGWEVIAGESEENPASGASAENLAYVMYTSGSTGRPKGTSIMHRSIVRLVRETNYVDLGAEEVFLQFAPISFDASTLEIWGALLNGGRLVVYPGQEASLQELGEVVQREQVTTLWLTAGLFHQMVEDHLEGLRPVRQLLAGGDVVSPAHVKEALEKLAGCRVINGYGPTENTTFTCCYPMREVSQVGTTVSIGRPIANTRVYILDGQLQPVPIGVTGELYIGGDGLARDYLKRPGLTAEKFIPDPFSAEPGGRLYATGDVARYLRDGNIEFLGRMDSQVKVRGFRIELGEIEAVLSEHPGVQKSVVLSREDETGEPSALRRTEKRLVAYVVPGLDDVETPDGAKGLQSEFVAQWQTLYEETYSQGCSEPDPTFNITGWNSSYTGLPIPAAEMREWVEQTVSRILSRQPRSVLEIGCGTGLLLLRLAPRCTTYWGTDFSSVALDYVRKQLRAERQDLGNVTLRQQMADDFTGIEQRAFDAVVLNSVVQYFPDVEYLLRVLEGAVSAVAPGGFIFVGDVRSLPLLEAFHTSVQLDKASSSVCWEELQRRVQAQIEREKELVLDPALFAALPQRLPQIQYVEIRPKRGRHINELTKYRYDVLLHVASGDQHTVETTWLDWQEEALTVPAIREMLLDKAPQMLGVRRVPNARLTGDLQALAHLKGGAGPEQVGDLRDRLGKLPQTGVDPEALWGLGDELPYEVDIRWSGSGAEACYDVLFRNRQSMEPRAPWIVFPAAEAATASVKAWGSYANTPLRGTLAARLVPQLRQFLAEKLPQYMVPSAFVMLDALPLTAIGKVDRAALPAPEQARSELEGAFVAPRTATERALAGIWEQVLGVEHVGLHDDFFELGGHSLLATQVISRVRDAFQVDIPLRTLFQAPTVAGLAEYVETIHYAAQGQRPAAATALSDREELKL
jgi:amino acid adenylation domain-containing protein